MNLRRATADDTEAIAALHADSWRRNYRGAFLDSFLDGDGFSDRLAVWSDRMTHPDPSTCTIIAERAGEFLGFADTKFDDDPTWGALLDNLHVTHAHKRLGIGTRLIVETARAVLARPEPTGFYLWVLEQNTPAQRFYKARGGTQVEREIRGPFPGGGTAPSLRMAWPEPARLIRSD